VPLQLRGLPSEGGGELIASNGPSSPYYRPRVHRLQAFSSGEPRGHPTVHSCRFGGALHICDRSGPPLHPHPLPMRGHDTSNPAVPSHPPVPLDAHLRNSPSRGCSCSHGSAAAAPASVTKVFTPSTVGTAPRSDGRWPIRPVSMGLLLPSYIETGRRESPWDTMIRGSLACLEQGRLK
jgi:hypothetical protein